MRLFCIFSSPPRPCPQESRGFPVSGQALGSLHPRSARVASPRGSCGVVEARVAPGMHLGMDRPAAVPGLPLFCPDGVQPTPTALVSVRLRAQQGQRPRTRFLVLIRGKRRGSRGKGTCHERRQQLWKPERPSLQKERSRIRQGHWVSRFPLPSLAPFCQAVPSAGSGETCACYGGRRLG